MPLRCRSRLRLHRVWPFGLVAFAAAIGGWQAIQPAGAEAARDDQTLTVVVAGDVGLNASNLPVDAKGVFKRAFQAWPDTTAAIAGDINGDLNFMNLETVITDRNDLTADTKGQSAPFNFRTHPAGLRQLVSAGFNVISLANNHSMDYGVAGLQETLRHVGALRDKGVLAASGIGMNREEASRPQLMAVKGSTV